MFSVTVLGVLMLTNILAGSEAVTTRDKQGADEESFSSTFTRTVWLPRPVDGSTVTGKLVDGVLTLTIPKATDKAPVKVNVE